MFVRRVVALAFAIALLAGCRLQADLAIDVRADGSGTVFVTVVADPELVSRAPGLVEDLRLDDLRAAGWVAPGSPGEQGAGPVVERLQDGSVSLRMAHGFADPAEANRLLASLNGPGGPLRDVNLVVTPSFGRVQTTLTGTVQLSGLDAFADDALRTALGSTVPFGGAVDDPGSQLHLSVTVRAPGVLRSGTGHFVPPPTWTGSPAPTSPATARWTLSPVGSASTPLEATFVWSDDRALAARDRRDLARMGLLAWSALVVLGGAFVAVALVRRRRLRRR